MKKLCQFKSEQDANKIFLALHSCGIQSHIREESQEFEVWVEEESHIATAEKILQTYREYPQDIIFQNSEPAVIKTEEKLDNYSKDIDSEMLNQYSQNKFPILTYFIIAFCILTFLIDSSKDLLMFSLDVNSRSFPEIREGQVWRLLTPAFLHGGILHILFNLMWMHQLGTMIERISGFRTLLAMIVVFGIISNVGQYFMSGPAFLGLSGVVYGLLGFVWAKEKCQAGSGYYLENNTMLFMMIWLVICLIGIIPNVANTAHVLGIIQGLLFGYISSKHVKTNLHQ